MKKGTLYLIPSLLGESQVDAVFPPVNREVISRIKHFIVEEMRTARRFLKKICPEIEIDSLTFTLYNEHTSSTDASFFLEPLLNGHDAGIISEAGTPCVADPGSLVVRLAHESGIRIVPLVGPSSILLALMASGFNGQNFAFLGYLPADKMLRVRKIKELEKTILEKDQTQIFIETPYRNRQVFESLIRVCRPESQLCLATDISGIHEVIKSQSIADWQNQKPDIHKRPTIFLLYR